MPQMQKMENIQMKIRKHYDKNVLSEFYYICILKTNFQNLDYTGNQNINLLKYARKCVTDLF